MNGDWKVAKEYLLLITWQSILVHIFVYRGMLLYDWIAFGTWFFWNNFYDLVHSALSLLLCGTSSKDQCIKLCKKTAFLTSNHYWWYMQFYYNWTFLLNSLIFFQLIALSTLYHAYWELTIYMKLGKILIQKTETNVSRWRGPSLA